jgi:hypothetical protein
MISWGTILGLSLNFGIWIKDAGWSQGDAPNTDDDERQSSFSGERFVEIKNESVNGVRRRGVPKKRIYFQLIVFKDFIFSYFFLLTKRI